MLLTNFIAIKIHFNLKLYTMEDSTEEQVQEIQVNEEKLARYKAQLETEQNFPMGLIAGFVACIVSAILWAAITYFTGYQISYMAIGVGFLVGFAIRIAGKGMSIIYGIIGAVFALLGCVLGNFLTLIALIGDMNGVGFMEMLSGIDFTLIIDMVKETTGFMDLLFYAAATFLGFAYAQREITDEELVEHAT